MARDYPDDMALNFDSYLPEGLHLKDYQQVGVAYALYTRRCFIADEQGLGKTWEALVTLEASGLFNRGGKAVIVCKATLRGNWESEISKLLPRRTVQVLGGDRPYETFADIQIISFNLLAAWKGYLDCDALVVDESQYLKNLGTEKNPVQRTVAALEIAASLPADALVLLLSGTAVENRPNELITQLRILGRLEEVSPRPRKGDDDKAWEYAFKFSFCGPKKVGDYWEFKGASNLPTLNERLRSSCFIRRLRKAVIGNNDTQRVSVKLSLNGALDEYRKAEADLIRFLNETQGTEAAAKARRAQALVRLNTLRTLAGLAKIEAAKDWVETFFEENAGRSLVVFATHIEVQKALVKAFPGCAHILGSEKDPEAQKKRFLAGETNLIVCSLGAAREGHTLVGPDIDCHDVLFVEQGWHPGHQSQGEDRINRIGQTAQFCFAHILLGIDTVDEWLFELIESKRVVVEAALNGTPLPDDVVESAVQDLILARLAGRF